MRWICVSRRRRRPSSARISRATPISECRGVDWLRTGRTVLTLERINGIHIDDRAAILAAGHRIEDLLRKAAAAFFNQVFRDGFFHADLHPGNMFVDADGAIAVVDFGIMGRLDRATRFYLADMLIGFLSGDYRRVAEVHFAAGYVPPQPIGRRLYPGLPVDRRADPRQAACRRSRSPASSRSCSRSPSSSTMETQPQLLLLQKTMVVIEGVGRRLDPRDQHLDPGAAADRGVDARQSRSRSQGPARAGDPRRSRRAGAAPGAQPRNTGYRLVARRGHTACRKLWRFRQPIVPGIWRSCWSRYGSRRSLWRGSPSPF